MRRPAGRRGRDADAADRRRRRAPEPGPPHDVATRRRSTARSCASIRTRARPPPGTRSRPAPTRTPAASSRTASETHSGSRSGPGRTRSGSATSAGTRGRRSTAIADPPATVENFGWPCYEGTSAAAVGVRQREPEHLREPLRRRHRRRRLAVLHVQPRRLGRHRRRLPDRRLVDRGAGVLPGRQLPGRVRERALLRRLLAQVHLGDAPGANGLPDPTTARPSSPLAAGPVDLQIGPGRRPLLRRLRRRDDPPDPVRRRPAADARARRRVLVQRGHRDERRRRSGQGNAGTVGIGHLDDTGQVRITHSRSTARAPG